MQTTNNLNVNQITPLTPPDEIKEELPLSEQACQTVVQARQTVRNILCLLYTSPSPRDLP